MFFFSLCDEAGTLPLFFRLQRYGKFLKHAIVSYIFLIFVARFRLLYAELSVTSVSVKSHVSKMTDSILRKDSISISAALSAFANSISISASWFFFVVEKKSMDIPSSMTILVLSSMDIARLRSMLNCFSVMDSSFSTRQRHCVGISLSWSSTTADDLLQSQ